MSILGTFILTTAITITVNSAPSGNDADAYKALTKATFIQTGADKQIKKFETKYIDEDIRKYDEWTIILMKISSEKKMGYEWRF